jgi:phosphohistidine phosphatase SixA
VTKAFRVALAAAIVFAPATSWAQVPQLQANALVQALRAGGYVILMRHAATEAKLDADPVDLSDCKTQRNLSPEGRAAAQDIGKRIAALGIPIGDVDVSPYCRAKDTAALMFGRADVVDGLRDAVVKDDSARAGAAAALRPLLAAPPPQGKNTIVVTHGFNAKAVTGIDLLEAESVVAKPDGRGGFTIVADVKADAWGTFAR